MKLVSFVGNWFFFLLQSQILFLVCEKPIDLKFFEQNIQADKTILIRSEDSRKADPFSLLSNEIGTLFFISLSNSQSKNVSNPFPDYAVGKEIFRSHCIACHNQGRNLIIPEKNLKKEALEANGMNNLNAISYQVINGKNGMPAFGGRLLEEEIEAVSIYVLKQSSLNFKE